MPTGANKLEEANVHHTGGYGKINSKASQSIYCHKRTDPKAKVPKQYVTFFKAYIIFHSNGSLLHSEQDTSVLPIL